MRSEQLDHELDRSVHKQTKRVRSTFTYLIVIAFALLGLTLLPGCQSQTTSSANDPNANTANNDRIAAGAPRDMHDIAGYLLRYRAEHFKLPDTLAELRLQGNMPMEGFRDLTDYAYDPDGMGTLGNGQKIILVDTAVRLEDHLWCLLEEPGLHPRATALNVTLVHLEDLQKAARQGR